MVGCVDRSFSFLQNHVTQPGFSHPLHMHPSFHQISETIESSLGSKVRGVYLPLFRQLVDQMQLPIMRARLIASSLFLQACR